jgi:integrase
MSQVGLRVSEACTLDLDDIKWGLGRFGQEAVRLGVQITTTGLRRAKLPAERMTVLDALGMRWT